MATESTLEDNDNTPMHQWEPIGLEIAEEE